MPPEQIQHLPSGLKGFFKSSLAPQQASGYWGKVLDKHSYSYLIHIDF
jgi:hypothetical protein